MLAKLILLRAPFIVVLLTVTYLSVTPMPELPGPTISDKIMHFGAYSFISFLGYVGFIHGGWRVAAFVIAWSIGIELVQWQLPTRSFELLDILANTLGCLAGWFVATTAYRFLCQKRQK
jgi:VanZ family protein